MHDRLTRIQRDLIARLASCTIAQAAAAMGMAPRSVRCHLLNIRRRLGVASIEDAMQTLGMAPNVFLRLSAKEIQVIEGLSDGRSRRQIAATMAMTHQGVSYLVQTAMRKTGASGPVMLALAYQRFKDHGPVKKDQSASSQVTEF